MTEPAVFPGVEEQEDERRCSGRRRDGSRCDVPGPMVLWDQDTEAWWCVNHHPSPEIIEARRLSRQRGALATRARFRRGLDPAELGELTTPQDAKRWSSVIALAVAGGRITPAQANAATRAVHEFLRSRDQVVRETELAALKRDLDALKRSPHA